MHNMLPAVSKAIKGFLLGEGAYREVAAYFLDHERFAGVLHTALLKFYKPSYEDNEEEKDKHQLFSLAVTVWKDCAWNQGSWVNGLMKKNIMSTCHAPRLKIMKNIPNSMKIVSMRKMKRMRMIALAETQCRPGNSAPPRRNPSQACRSMKAISLRGEQVETVTVSIFAFVVSVSVCAVRQQCRRGFRRTSVFHAFGRAITTTSKNKDGGTQ